MLLAERQQNFTEAVQQLAQIISACPEYQIDGTMWLLQEMEAQSQRIDLRIWYHQIVTSGSEFVAS